MANLVMARPDVYLSGTTVGLYLAGQAQPGLQGSPSGSSISTAAATDSNVTLTGADPGKWYAVHAVIGGVNRYVFRLQS
jgi:hypothetical protein